MPDFFADRLLDAIDRCGSPVCVGIDPMLESLPAAVRDRAAGGDSTSAEAGVDAIYDFCLSILKTVAGLVPIVKFQSAYFEKYHWEGVEAYFSLIQQAKELGLLVIGDVKRGDIASTAAAYASAHLDDSGNPNVDDAVVLPDAVTVNPMLGMDTLEPFVKVARKLNKGLFVLVRTSNPGSAQLQDAALADGRTWSEMLADQVNILASDAELVGRRGYSGIGAVVGATQSQTMVSLRKRLPKSIFLLPGYGAQGATADQTRAAFQNGYGAIVSASRSILYAFSEPRYAEKFGNNWQKCVEQAVLDMKGDLKRVLGG
ncbi:MAG: orotidine-5'-phosphate decarboxylase [Tepidisphaeraceae bacterium]